MSAYVSFQIYLLADPPRLSLEKLHEMAAAVPKKASVSGHLDFATLCTQASASHIPLIVPVTGMQGLEEHSASVGWEVQLCTFSCGHNVVSFD